jgi:hypothetical protein
LLVDGSDPASPVLLSPLGAIQDPALTDCGVLRIHKSTLYCLQEYDGLAIADISDPSAPFLTAFIHKTDIPGMGSPAYSFFEVYDNLLYILNYSGSIAVLDVVTPTMPVVVGYQPPPQLEPLPAQGAGSLDYDSGILAAVYPGFGGLDSPRRLFARARASSVPVGGSVGCG